MTIHSHRVVSMAKFKTQQTLMLQCGGDQFDKTQKNVVTGDTSDLAAKPHQNVGRSRI